MNNFLLLVEKFEGIIGALLGVMMTLTLTEVFKRSGRTRFYKKKLDVGYEVSEKDSSGYHSYRKTEKKDEANFFRADLTIEVCNTSDTPKILRDAMLTFYNKKDLVLSVVPEDKTTEKFGAGRFYRDEFGFINIKPKEIISVDLVCLLNEPSQIDKIKKCNKLYLESRNYKNKIERVYLVDLA